MTPLLTIGIPVHNEERFLAQTIESALNQTFTDYQIILSDNCSTDHSYEIACAYADRAPRLTVVRHSENIGAPANFYYSLNRVQTKYFAWLGAHDIFLPDYLKAAIDVLEANPDIVLAYPKSALIDADAQIVQNGYRDSDIDTIGLSLQERLFKITQNLWKCTSIHGVFRTAVLKQLPWKSIIGADRLLLTAAAAHGDIRMLDIIGIHRREVRHETGKQMQARWQEGKVYQQRQRDASPYIDMVFEHLVYLLRESRIPWNQKIPIMVGIKRILASKYNVSWKQLGRRLFNLPAKDK